MKFSWKQFGIALCLFLAGYFTFNGKLFAQTPEKTKVAIAVGGKNLFYYLPLTIAEQLGYFKDEGLDVTISDFAGGAKALQALVGGSADVVSGAFEHTISMQAKNQHIVAFVLQGRAPQIVMGVSNKTMPNYKSIADLKGKKIGVTAPGSSTSMMSNFVLAKGGLKPTDVSYIGVGASAGALSALRSGSIDVIANLDPLITMMQQNNEIRIIADTRTLKDTNAVFGGPIAGLDQCEVVGFADEFRFIERTDVALCAGGVDRHDGSLHSAPVGRAGIEEFAADDDGPGDTAILVQCIQQRHRVGRKRTHAEIDAGVFLCEGSQRHAQVVTDLVSASRD